jgi:transposase IS200 family protein
MSHTYSSNRVHVIFSTKERQKRLPEDTQPKLWAYMAGVAHNHGFEATMIGGVADHNSRPSGHTSIDADSQSGASRKGLFVEF